jgi:hypothetical protein
MISLKRLDHKAQLARHHFAQHGPCDAPPLPLDHNERESIKGKSPLNTMVGLYARSWEASDYDLERHPSFYEYACGVMASEYNGWPGLARDPEMLRRVLAKLRAAQTEATQAVDPWRLRLERVRGTVGFDGLERISTQTVMDVLDVPQRQRTAGAYRHLAKIMSDLGWTAVRVRDITRGGYKEQVRGYVRKDRNHHSQRI